MKALSTIYNKDILNVLLEIAKNKEYKDVNFPIIFTLRKYRDKRVKMLFEKIEWSSNENLCFRCIRKYLK